jgi:nucleoid-associated protein YgaU
MWRLIVKNIIVYLLAVLAVLGVLSCKSAPADAAFSPVIKGEVTQEKVNTTLTQIYDNYRNELDMSGAQTYVVKKGDTLSNITRDVYGAVTDAGNAGRSNGFYFPLIMLASEQGIVDPDLIEPGMTLVIPDLRKNLDNPANRQAIKDCLRDVAYVYNKKGNSVAENGLLTLADSL